MHNTVCYAHERVHSTSSYVGVLRARMHFLGVDTTVVFSAFVGARLMCSPMIYLGDFIVRQVQLPPPLLQCGSTP